MNDRQQLLDAPRLGLGGTRWWVVLLILSAAGTRSYFAPKSLSYALCALVTVAFCVYLLRLGELTIAVPLVPLSLLAGITAPLYVNSLADISAFTTARLAAFVLFSFIFIIYIPSAIQALATSYTLSRLGAAFVLVGVPASVLGEYSLGGIQIQSWEWGFPFPILDSLDLSPMVSVFTNPNVVGLAAAIGAACALHEAASNREWNPVVVILLSVNCLGVVLSGSRAALLAVIAAFGLHTMYRLFGRLGAVLAGCGAFLGLCLATVVVLRVPPFGTLTGGINFHGRQALWQAAVESILARPEGYGAVDRTKVLASSVADRWQGSTAHNSFFRVFLSAGVGGGVAYIALMMYAVLSPLRVGDAESVGVSGMAVTAVVLQTFASFSVFGLSFNSVVTALVVGVAVTYQRF